MVENWNNYLLHLFLHHRILFGCYSVLFFWIAGVTLETVTRWPPVGHSADKDCR